MRQAEEQHQSPTTPHPHSPPPRARHSQELRPPPDPDRSHRPSRAVPRTDPVAARHRLSAESPPRPPRMKIAGPQASRKVPETRRDHPSHHGCRRPAHRPPGMVSDLRPLNPKPAPLQPLGLTVSDPIHVGGRYEPWSTLDQASASRLVRSTIGAGNAIGGENGPGIRAAQTKSTPSHRIEQARPELPTFRTRSPHKRHAGHGKDKNSSLGAWVMGDHSARHAPSHPGHRREASPNLPDSAAFPGFVPGTSSRTGSEHVP